MAEYIFPTFIFITTLFILGILIKPSNKLLGIICMVGAGFLTYVITEAAKSAPENSSIIYVFSFVIIFGIFVAIVIAKREDINLKLFSGFYSVIILIAFFSAKGCYNGDKEINDRKIAKNNAIETYKKQYDFNVDSYTTNIDLAKPGTRKNKVLKSPIIVYIKRNGKTEFDYDFNKTLERNLISFSIDSIKTIVVLENVSLDVGRYTNGTTDAQKIQTTISFIEKRTMSEMSLVTLTGGEPPSSISYSHGAPASRSGSAPTQYEIVEAIKMNLNK
jgi:hypothetical protein